MTTIDKATDELYRMFAALNDKYFEGGLPIPAITIQTQGKRAAYGWCSTVPFWKSHGELERYEINMSAEFLSREVLEIARTLLHEMVHLHNAAVVLIQDCSRGGTYHNKRFKETTERLNMFKRDYDKPDSKHGWSQCDLTEETILFVTSLATDEKCFSIYRAVPKASKKKSNSYKLECPMCGIKVRATKPGLAIRCTTCDMDMEEID